MTGNACLKYKHLIVVMITFRVKRKRELMGKMAFVVVVLLSLAGCDPNGFGGGGDTGLLAFGFGGGEGGSNGSEGDGCCN